MAHDHEDLKPYFVDVHLTVRVPVVAKDPDDASRVARDHVACEIEDGMGIENAIDHTTPTLATLKSHEVSALPWGVCDQNDRRNWTIKQWLEAQETPPAE